ncbi:hypothetical protein [Winogradskyella sp. UBA3174]|uniref:hypothetical protein n=1 Tax=Winogradskyella sp. UBA3174 TaxID=1947785 RepID=UPI0025D40884|nr:hypothetical protein [Winogradskyella sp. UBA3174]|tara:strand:+ start:74713 stop:75930 length:1218 start_codon:yes stop_codon:yes gene_type:complete
MTLKYLYISILCILLISTTVALQISEASSYYKSLSKQSTFTAGDTIELKFLFSGNADVYLYCSNSYGSVVLNPIATNTKLSFSIPKSVSKKSGILNWQLISDKTEVTGQVNIKPKTSIKTIESYLGPPSIEAGGTDFTMLVIIPTDDLDNPLIDSTKVEIKRQFLVNQNTSDVFTEHGFGYRNIYSETKSGRILISSEVLELNSKEYDVNVVPAIPTNFEINAERIHDYADGNQITTFKTTVIKDRYCNNVSDGTFVTFFITNKDGYKSKTSGLTINGIAVAELLHPDHEEQWSIKAYVEGMANSNKIELDYKQAISDFDVVFSEDKRTINIGPLKSFMSQRAPDGLQVNLLIYKDGLLQEQFIESSFNGKTKFHLNTDRFPKGNYNLEIKVAGMTKTFSDMSYE